MNRKAKAERINEILDAVIELKSQANGEYVQASQIAARAGISTRTLNRFFPDYDIMIFEAAIKYLDGYFDEILNRFNSLDISKLNGLQQIILFLNTQIESYKADLLGTILFIEANIRCASIGMDKKCRKQSRGNEVSRIAVDCIHRGIEDGSIRKELDAEKTTLLISANFNGLMQRLIFVYRTQSMAVETDDIFAMMKEFTYMVEQYLRA